ncbi:polyhydroxyalkanoate depolymerase [Aquabacterium sp.]|jgi:poly(3-hydroxybutyrate) depolymerase|uniref:polyhydroxyalkanoate depolymerase n=1 Tax=Aquabacterium sp. TaxID=1872578 RepID=UPI002487CE93|nr:polyhydroxyalkanoate depolymerase [Aquabacterium sp.]MDI1348377.1 polyhydroxyalkanoate depolymerase [Aquabacterium sp.]
MLYAAYETHHTAMAPWRAAARSLADTLHGLLPDGPAQSSIEEIMAGGALARSVLASCEVFARLALTHHRPAYGIDSVVSQGRECEIVEEQVMRTPFGTLLRFRKEGAPEQPRVLLVAPMSGHFATLLRDTIRTLLQDHDVYITDWHNARDVPLKHGVFGLDDYTEHLIQFLTRMGPGSHLMAICQPCVAALSATALMAQDGHPAQPRSLTLMAGPIDCRVNPTAVNELATSKPLSWFEENLVHTVPWTLRGAGRRVYPGFVQLSAFMSMNEARHRQAFQDMRQRVAAGLHDEAKPTQTFYEEYFAVADLPAEFYLETVGKVFQTYDLPRGSLSWRDTVVDPSAIRRTALMTVEGERDDICAVGQTVAAQDLCTAVRPYWRNHHVQTGVGHYGVFSGKRWQREIYPRVRDLIHQTAV